MNARLDKAIKAANANGHHLASDHTTTARRWTCVVCSKSVSLHKDGIVSGSAARAKCDGGS